MKLVTLVLHVSLAHVEADCLSLGYPSLSVVLHNDGGFLPFCHGAGARCPSPFSRSSTAHCGEETLLMKWDVPAENK